jgi:hypothetical protein
MNTGATPERLNDKIVMRPERPETAVKRALSLPTAIKHIHNVPQSKAWHDHGEYAICPPETAAGLPLLKVAIVCVTVL